MESLLVENHINVFDAENNLRKAISHEMEEVAREFDLEIKVRNLIVHSTRKKTIAIAPVKTKKSITLEELLLEDTPVYLFYLDLPKDTGVPEGVFIVKIIDEGRNVGLLDLHGRVLLKGDLDLRVHSQGQTAQIIDLDCSFGQTGHTINVCCKMSGSSGPVSIQFAMCLSFNLLDVLDVIDF